MDYQTQRLEQSRRTCGAACLSMTYSALGKRVPEEEIWPAIAKRNSLGSVACTTHLMTQDACERGFCAVAMQARYPLQSLRVCSARKLPTILNLRVDRHRPAGHYSVLVGIDERSVILHDPLVGPARTMSHAELLELWQPGFGKQEITGNVLIVVGHPESGIHHCDVCNSELPSQVKCPYCGNPVLLHPAAALGCMGEECPARLWNSLCCPACDTLFDHTGQAARPSTAEEDARRSVANLFRALDQFVSRIASHPAASNNSDLKAQLAFIAASRERFQAAYAEESGRRAYVREQIAGMQRSASAKAAEAQHRQKNAEEPLPRLNGYELGQALMKNLGLKM